MPRRLQFLARINLLPIVMFFLCLGTVFYESISILSREWHDTTLMVLAFVSMLPLFVVGVFWGMLAIIKKTGM